MPLKDLVRDWVPPALLRTLRRLRGSAQPSEWSYLPGGWPASGATGWEDPSVAETQRRLWPGFAGAVEGPGPLGINHTDPTHDGCNHGAHNTVISFGYVLTRAAAGRDRVSLLDWGGGAGHYALFARALLPGVQVDYHCRDVPSLCAAGRDLVPEGTFHDTDDSLAGRTFDLVLASGSLHYSRDWRAALRLLRSLARDLVFVTRLPIVGSAPSFVVLQRPHAAGYRTEYAGWVLNRDELLAGAAEAGLRLEREFLVAEAPVIPGAPEQNEYRGFLFRTSP